MNDVLDTALDMLEEPCLIENDVQALLPREMGNNAPAMVQINQTKNEETANFDLEIPGFNWQAMLEMAKPNFKISGWNVSINFGK